MDIRRRLLARVGETPEALRDLSVSLNNVGKTAQALGQWDEARQAYQDCCSQWAGRYQGGRIVDD